MQSTVIDTLMLNYREYVLTITPRNSVGLCLHVRLLLHSTWQWHCDPVAGHQHSGFTALLALLAWPCHRVVYIALSSCTTAPSAWKLQCNYNPCFVLAWSTVFNTGPFFKKIAAAALRGGVPVHGLCSCMLQSSEDNRAVRDTLLHRNCACLWERDLHF